MMKYCSQCGHELTDEAAFCSNCGATTQSKGQIYDINRQNQTKDTSLKGKGIGILLTFFLGVIGLILCYVIGDEDCKKGALSCFIICTIIGVIIAIFYGFLIFTLV